MVSTSSVSVARNQQTVLLQTAYAWASANLGDASQYVRILFDSGSQLSYVPERLQAKQGLKQLELRECFWNQCV